MLSAGKLVSGVVALGATGSAGVVVGCVYLLEPKETTIEELLKTTSPKSTILTTSNKANGTKAWKSYKDEKGNEIEKWKINDWTSVNSGDSFTDSLAGVCEKRKIDKVKRVTDQDYLSFVNWCTFQTQ